MYVCIHIYIYREREREREIDLSIGHLGGLALLHGLSVLGDSGDTA